jgi:hypothetical protein
MRSGSLRWERLSNEVGVNTFRFSNDTPTPVMLRFSVPRQVVATRTVLQERQIGVEVVEYCDPVTQVCSVIRQPVYEVVAVREPVYADLRIEPRRLKLVPGSSEVVIVARTNSLSHIDFDATLLLRIGWRHDHRSTIGVQFGDP